VYVYGAVPPVTVTVADPLLPPLQLTCRVLVMLADTGGGGGGGGGGAAAGSNIDIVLVATHPLASVTVYV
jgi:hypothetical protein